MRGNDIRDVQILKGGGGPWNASALVRLLQDLIWGGYFLVVSGSGKWDRMLFKKTNIWTSRTTNFQGQLPQWLGCSGARTLDRPHPRRPLGLVGEAAWCFGVGGRRPGPWWESVGAVALPARRGGRSGGRCRWRSPAHRAPVLGERVTPSRVQAKHPTSTASARAPHHGAPVGPATFAACAPAAAAPSWWVSLEPPRLGSKGMGLVVTV